MARATSEMDATGADVDEEQDIQRLQADGLDGQEITSKDLVLVVTQQMPPIAGVLATLRRRWNAMPSQDSSSCRRPKPAAQLQHFPRKAVGVPARIVPRQAHHEG